MIFKRGKFYWYEFEYIQWRTNRTRRYALRKKSGVELAGTFEPVSVGCVNRDLAALRRVLNVGCTRKLITVVPIIRLLPGEKNHERVLSHTEENLYLAKAPLLLRQFATTHSMAALPPIP